MPEWLYVVGNNENAVWVFILLTLVIGGSAAWVTGKAIAQTWRPFLQLPWYVLLLTGGVRFLHHALWWEPLFPIQNWVVDYLVLFAFALIGYRRMRALQIPAQYPWLYAPAGLFGWQRRGG